MGGYRVKPAEEEGVHEWQADTSTGETKVSAITEAYSGTNIQHAAKGSDGNHCLDRVKG